MEDRDPETHIIDWQGLTLRIDYNPQWGVRLDCPAEEGGSPVFRVAHLEVRSTTPKKAPLPITETGYRSHFCNPDDVEELGGVVAYVMAWLLAEADTPEWKAANAAGRQLSLF